MADTVWDQKNTENVTSKFTSSFPCRNRVEVKSIVCFSKWLQDIT